MTLLSLLENGSAPIISLPQFSKSFWTSKFIVFEMNSRFSSAHRAGVNSAQTNSCKTSAVEKIFFMIKHCHETPALSLAPKSHCGEAPVCVVQHHETKHIACYPTALRAGITVGFLIKQKGELTTLPVLRYSSGP